MSTSEHFRFSVIRPGVRLTTFFGREGDPLAEARSLLDQGVSSLVGLGKVDTVPKARRLLTLLNAFSDCCFSASDADRTTRSPILDDRWNITEGLSNQLLVPIAFVEQIPWIKSDFRGYRSETEKHRVEDDVTIGKKYSHHMGVTPMNLGTPETWGTPCLIESIGYETVHPNLFDPPIQLVQITTPDSVNEPVGAQWIEMNAVATDPYHSTAEAILYPDDTTQQQYSGRFGTQYAAEYRDWLTEAGYPTEEELLLAMQHASFDHVWNAFCENAAALKFVNPLSYFSQ